MRLPSLLPLSVLLAGIGLASADNASNVISLTPDNFASVVNKETLILVEFFAPWCGHCKALAPEYEEAATALREKDIKLAKVDCVEQADLCQQHEVRGYPTLKVYHHGVPTEYAGPRKADGIISYMIKQSLPAVATVKANNYSEFQHADKLVLMAYLSTPTEAPGPEFTATAEKHRDDWLFGYTTDKETIEQAGVTPPAIVLYRKFDEPRVDFSGHVPSATVKEIEDFVEAHSIPLVDEVNADNYSNYVKNGLPLAFLFVDPTASTNDELIESLRLIAAKYKGKLNFVWIDAIKFSDHAKILYLFEAKWPSFVIQEIEQQRRYPLDQAIDTTPEAIDAWVHKYVSGELQPQLKSEPVPETQEEAVCKVVGKTFDEVVFDDSKDVFIEFYAPWCGHCKRLKPTWDALGERYANIKDRLVIAKMDATENDLPTSVNFQIPGFPTIKFKPAGSREFIDFPGDRTLESFIEFVEEHAKNSLVPPTSSSVSSSLPPSSAAEPVTTPQEQVPLHEEL